MYPRWLSFLVLVFFGYLLYAGTHHSTTVKPAQPAPVAASTTDINQYPAIKQAADLDRWKRAINPDYAAIDHCELEAKDSTAPALTLKSMDDAEGTGSGAKCTESIKVNLTVWNAKGKPSYRGEVSLRLGMKEVATGLDASLVGLKVGGVRTIILPPAALAHEKKSPAPSVLLNALKGDTIAVITVSRIE